MADSEQDQGQRTEQPTEKRLEEARRRGQIPRSRELGMALVTLAGAASLLLLKATLGRQFAALLTAGLTLDRSAMLDAEALPEALARGLETGLYVFAPLAGAAVLAALAASVAFGGWVFSFESLAPKLERLDPFAGLRRVFGWNGLAELAKALAKFSLVGIAAAALLWQLASRFVALGRLPIERALGEAARLAAISFVGFAAILLVIAAVDVPFQWWQHRTRLRMTKQEVRDELKESEGKPELRSRIRSVQREIAQRRMMEAVPKADFVAVNPTHFAVAVRYDATRMRAPKVVAKGVDLIALNIRNLAKAHGVPLFEHRAFAQALYYSTPLGGEVPQRLYVAVAQVLTYIYQLRRRPATRRHPLAKPDIEVDPDLITRPGREAAGDRA
jgi:flagellar biosynthesis protein FlhB